MISAHLRRVAPWGAEVELTPREAAPGALLAGGGPGEAAALRALEGAYGKAPVKVGSGGAIPLCVLLARTLPSAEIILWVPPTTPRRSTPPMRASTCATSSARRGRCARRGRERTFVRRRVTTSRSSAMDGLEPGTDHPYEYAVELDGERRLAARPSTTFPASAIAHCSTPGRANSIVVVRLVPRSRCRTSRRTR